MTKEMNTTLSIDQKKRRFNRNAMKRDVEILDEAEAGLFLLSDNSKGIRGDVLHFDDGTIELGNES